MKSKTEKFWDKNAKRFDDNDKKAGAEHKEIIAKTRKHLTINDHVLDFGCATGNITIVLANEVKHMHGLDISAEMIRNANKKKDDADIMNITFSKGSIFDDDFEKSSFDKITAYAILHLMEDVEKVIQRIHELLKPGGLFISLTACMKDKLGFKSRFDVTIFLLMKKLGMMPLHLNMYKTADVEKLIADQNFEIIVSEKISHGIKASFIVAKKQ